MQIISGALIAGVTIAVVIAIVVSMGRVPAVSALSYIAVGVAVLMTILRAIIPSMFARRAVDQLATSGSSSDGVATKSRLYGVYQVSMIIDMAMLEGAAVLCLIAYGTDVSVLPLTAVGVLLLLMLFSFPTRTRVEDWVEDQRRLMNF